MTDRDQIRQTISEALADVLDEDSLTLTDDTTAEDVSDWDSVNHVRLIVALESRFNIRFDTTEIGAPENVGALVDLIQSKLNK